MSELAVPKGGRSTVSGHNNSPRETHEQLLKEKAPEDMRVLYWGKQ